MKKVGKAGLKRWMMLVGLVQEDEWNLDTHTARE